MSEAAEEIARSEAGERTPVTAGELADRYGVGARTGQRILAAREHLTAAQ